MTTHFSSVCKSVYVIEFIIFKFFNVLWSLRSKHAKDYVYIGATTALAYYIRADTFHERVFTGCN